MADTIATPSRAVLEMLLSESYGAFTPFVRALDGLSPEDSVRVPAGSPHSVADIVGHMVFWQQRFLSMVDGNEPVPVPHAAVGWRTVAAHEWQGLVATYLAGMDRFRSLAADEENLGRPVVKGRPTTLGAGILDSFVHDAHHLGQVILLRRMLGAWPPPGGGDTW